MLDDIDKSILQALRKEGRLSMARLAERVGVGRATVYNRVDRLSAEGVIDGFTVRVNPAKVGLTVAALVTVQIKQHAWRRLRHEFASIPEVEYVALTAGEFDMVMLVRASSMEALRDVVLERLQTMPDVLSTRTLFVLDEVRP